MGTAGVPSGYIHTPNLRRLAIAAGFRLHQLARAAGMSLATLNRRIVAQFRLTSERWLVRVRMELAPRYLRQWKKAAVVAVKLGYKQVSHLCRHFKQFHGCSIKEWWERERQRHRDRRARRRTRS